METKIDSAKRKSIAVAFLAAGLAAIAALAGPRLAHTCCPARPAGQAATPATKQATRSIALRVDGMTCASCAVTVRLAVKRLDGVRNVQVDTAARRAVIDYDSTKVTPRQLIDAVGRAGYQATLAPETGA